MPRRKQVYKITHPNGEIYVGMDLTGTALYVGQPQRLGAQIVADLELDSDLRFELTLCKEIPWESETATDAEVRAIETKLIRKPGPTIPPSATTSCLVTAPTRWQVLASDGI